MSSQTHCSLRSPLANLHTLLVPSVEVVLHVDAAADALLLAHRPELLEGPGALDGRLVVAGRDKDVIVAAIRVDGALPLCTAGRVVGAVRLNNIVLNERVAGPAVDGEVAIALGSKVAAIVDGAD